MSGLEDAIAFIKIKIVSAERTLKCRDEMRQIWQTGSDKSWAEAGCSMSKAERLKEANIHRMIVAKNKLEIEMFKMVLLRLENIKA